MFAEFDAWVLLALIWAREPADRDRPRYVGDYLHRTDFTDDELEGGLSRLLRAGDAVDLGGRFAPSSRVLAWYRQSTDVHVDPRRVSTFLGIREGD